MGTGTAGGSLRDAMSMLIDTCLAYLDGVPESRARGIYVIARIPKHLDSGIAVLDRHPGLEKRP